jgi:hypothetical protein
MVDGSALDALVRPSSEFGHKVL